MRGATRARRPWRWSARCCAVAAHAGAEGGLSVGEGVCGDLMHFAWAEMVVWKGRRVRLQGWGGLECSFPPGPDWESSDFLLPGLDWL